MANRTLQRSILLQTLYEWDMRGTQNEFIESYLSYTYTSFNNITEDNISDLLAMAQNIGKKRVVIDEIIEKAAPDWPMHKIALTDRNVLRIGLYELLFGDHDAVPPKVAINEAVELAKRFGGQKSNKFINGILGAVYREIGEPGKDQLTKSKMPEVAYEDMPIDQKGSAVIYSIDKNNVIRIGMVHDIFGYWTLSKGTIEEGEDTQIGIVRIIKNKINLDIRIIDSLGDNEYIAYHPERGPVRKQIVYFLAQSEHTQPQLEKDPGGIDDVRWFELTEISDLNMYEDVSQMLIKSIEIILATHQEPTLNSLESDPASLADVDINTLNVAELRAIAKERNIAEHTTMKKAELIEVLS